MNINMKKMRFFFFFQLTVSKESEVISSGETKSQVQVGNESKTHLLLLQKQTNAKIAIRPAFGKNKQILVCVCAHHMHVCMLASMNKHNTLAVSHLPLDVQGIHLLNKRRYKDI